MRQISWLVLLGVLAIGATACDGGGTPTAESPVAVEEAPVAIPIPSTAPQAATTPPLDTVVVGSLPPELIASTNANQRVQDVQRNRPDPFARVATAPIVQVERTAQPAQPAQSAAPQQSRPNNGSGGLQPSQLAPIPNLVPGAGRATPQLPPEPQPSLARAVQVSGVVQIGNVPYAIVTAPNEPTSRYVRVGQMLSNGEVLVKRIDMSQGYEPVVVLEQLGVEVVRSVGGGGAPTT
jgi:hypothetical protein